MVNKKNKQKNQAKQARQDTSPKPQKSLLRDNEVLKKVFSSLFYFAGSVVAVYELINYFRSDTKTFVSLIIPGLIGIVWLIVLVQMFRRGNSYAYVLLAITVVGGVVGGIGWKSYNQTQEDKVIVLVAQFDGPEETYGLRRQIMEDLQHATTGYDDTLIIEGGELVTSSETARELGEQGKADLVIWAWYRPTENPNITIHIENLTPTVVETIRESETYQPQATLAKLESFEIQKQLGSEMGTLISFLTGLLRYETGDYQIALKHLEQISLERDISTFIDPSNLYFYMAFSHTELGQKEQAIQDYDKAIELNPSSPAAYNNRGVAFHEIGQYELAIQDYDKAIEANPQLAMAYDNRGLAHSKLGEYEQAIEDFNQAIEISPQVSDAHYNRGIAYHYLEQYDRAIQDYNKAIEINPQFTPAYINRGRAYDELRKYGRAIQDYDKAIEISPQIALAYYNRGTAYANLEQYEQAVHDFEKAIELLPEYANAYVSRGLAYQALGKNVEAEADFKKYEELTGEKP